MGAYGPDAGSKPRPGRTLSAHAPSRILIVKLTSIGDVAHTIPVSHAMAQRWPEARIDWLVGARAAPYVELLPWVDRIFRYDLAPANGLRSLVRRTRRVAAELRRRRYDLTVDFQGLLRSSAWTVLAGAAVRAGRGRWPWLHVSVPMYDAVRTPHAIENTARPLESLGLRLDGFLDRFQREAVPDLAARLRKLGREWIDRLELKRPYHVWLAQSSWPSKCLPVHRLDGAPAGVSQLVIGDERFRDVRLPSRGDWRNLSGLPLSETAGLCLLADRVLAADTGPAQFAALMGARVVGCFGPTLARRTGLRGPHARNLQGACTGCYRRTCRRSEICLSAALDRAVACDADSTSASLRA